jgi:hypothetical protein
LPPREEGNRISGRVLLCKGGQLLKDSYKACLSIFVKLFLRVVVTVLLKVAPILLADLRNFQPQDLQPLANSRTVHGRQ